MHGWWGLARGLWWVSIPLWVVLVYATLFAVVLRHDKPGLERGINGTWFLLTVSLESIAVLGALLLGRDPGDLLAFACLAAFTLGLVLYLIVMTMVFLRWTFQPLEPDRSRPARVDRRRRRGDHRARRLEPARTRSRVSDRIVRVAPFLEGVVALAWATATFWFPLMIAIGMWRHIVRRVPLRYTPAYWAMVFPLGMYGAATYRMRGAIDLDSLGWVPGLAFAIALAAWTLTFVGLVHSVATGRRNRRTATAAPVS